MIFLMRFHPLILRNELCKRGGRGLQFVRSYHMLFASKSCFEVYKMCANFDHYLLAKVVLKYIKCVQTLITIY